MVQLTFSRLALLATAALVPLANAFAIHNTVVSATNLTRSLQFYVDGIGLDIIRPNNFTGDLKTLFGSRSTTVPGYFLGDKACGSKEVNGNLYLVQYDDVRRNPTLPEKSPLTGVYLTSFWVGDQFNAILARLKKMGLGGKPHIATFGNPPRTYATVLDPDGALVLLDDIPYITPTC